MVLVVSFYIIGMILFAYYFIWCLNSLEDEGLGITTLGILLYPLVVLPALVCKVFTVVSDAYIYLDSKSKRWFSNLKKKQVEKIIFKKCDYNKKIAFIQNMSTKELFRLDKNTLLKIIKRGIKIDSNKTIGVIAFENKSEGLGTTIKEVIIYDKKLFIELRIQGVDTVYYKLVTWEDFITIDRFPSLRLFIYRSIYPAPIKYTEDKIAEVIRTILIKVLQIRYKK